VSVETELLDIATTFHDGRAVVKISGEIDAYSTARLRQQLVGISQAGHHRLIIDMTNVPLMDSSGLGVLVGAMKRARANRGDVCIIGAGDRIVQTLRITGLTQVFPAFGSLWALT
jgi:anti-sigma B factor antagonist